MWSLLIVWCALYLNVAKCDEVTTTAEISTTAPTTNTGGGTDLPTWDCAKFDKGAFPVFLCDHDNLIFKEEDLEEAKTDFAKELVDAVELFETEITFRWTQDSNPAKDVNVLYPITIFDAKYDIPTLATPYDKALDETKYSDPLPHSIRLVLRPYDYNEYASYIIMLPDELMGEVVRIIEEVTKANYSGVFYKKQIYDFTHSDRKRIVSHIVSDLGLLRAKLKPVLAKLNATYGDSSKLKPHKVLIMDTSSTWGTSISTKIIILVVAVLLLFVGVVLFKRRRSVRTDYKVVKPRIS